MGRRKSAAHKSARMPVTRGLSLRSRVPRNWHARFWSRGGGSDSLAYCNLDPGLVADQDEPERLRFGRGP